jgi:hypothetical protein
VAVPLSGFGQDELHALQLAALTATFTHAPSHSTLPVGQPDAEHFPATQSSPAAHAWLHPPQCAELCCVSTHASSHFTRPIVHVKPQAPSTQVGSPNAGALQRWPQPLQLAGSPRVSTHVPPQGAKPASQTTPHCPFAQFALPFGGSAHALPHPPQCSRQPVSPLGHVLTHPVGAHSWSTGQAISQPPQWLGFVRVSTQVPTQGV